MHYNIILYRGTVSEPKAAHVVASILARRVAIEVSDSEPDSDSDDTEWTGS